MAKGGLDGRSVSVCSGGVVLVDCWEVEGGNGWNEGVLKLSCLRLICYAGSTMAKTTTAR